MENSTKMPVILKGMENVLMNVTKVPTKTLFKNENLRMSSDKSCAIIRDNQILGLVSPNYSLIKPSDFNYEMLEAFQKTEFGDKLSLHGSIDPRGNWEIRYETSYPKPDGMKKHDEINPFVSFSNGLSGTKSGNAGGGAMRLVCTNGMMSRVTKEIFAQKVRNTKNTQDLKLGIDFDDLVQKYLRYFESFGLVIEEQKELIGQEFKKEQILPVFYELTKDTSFPMSKFQTAFDRIAFEAKELGYTEMNRYLAYAGLNYILEHDSMQMDLNKVKEIDHTISQRLANLSISQSVKNFNQIVKSENERIEMYQAENDGKSPRGKSKVLELDLSAF
jgi:hypothetical protein